MGSSNDNFVDKINERNAEFWRERQAIFEKQIEDPEVVLAALGRGALEAAQKPFAERVSFVALVDQSAEQISNSKGKLIRDMGRKGGRCRKPDAFRKFLMRTLENDPGIANRELLRKIMKRDGDGTIEVLVGPHFDDKPSIRFTDECGKSVTVPISAVKHRISRAKKALSR